jgi:ATP-binding protein involved in chromosome partitioning
MALEKIKIIIGIIAGKGGVGKSTVTVNVARKLMQKGYLTGILDGDIYGPSIRKMLPEDILPSQCGEKIAPAVGSSIKMISKAFLKRGEGVAVLRAPIANGIILKFLHDVDWGELDVLLIDFPPGTGDIQITLLQQGGLSGVIAVTTPQEVAVMDVEKAMQMVVQMGVPILGVVENMSFYLPENGSGKEGRIYPFGKKGGEKLAQNWEIPFLGEIPLDPELSRALDCGEPIRGVELNTVFQEITEKMLEEVSKRQEYLLKFELMWKDMT